MFLVVDDDELACDVTAWMLRGAGHFVLTATSGDEALRIVEEDGGVRLVVADVNMPGMTGLELADRLRQSNSAVPVLFISGAMSRRQVVGSSRPYLQKPFSQAELLREVHRLLDDA